MARRTTGIAVALLVVALFAASAEAASAATGKPETLRVLTQCARTQIPARVASIVRQARTEASQLELDLVFYSWACSQAGRNADVRSLDIIIPALERELKDPTITWAIRYFSTNPQDKADTSLPSRDDPRTQALFDLKTKYRSAMDYRKSSPIQAVSALQEAAGLCQQLHLDLGEALVLRRLGDHYLYDMARYALAEACYERSAWTFPAYRCWAASALVYDDFAYLNTETGRYAIATEYYIEAGRHWEQLANQDPSRYRYRDMAGREYVKAGFAAGDYSKALELMRGKGIGQLQIWATATKSYDVLIRSLMEIADFCRGAGDAATALDLLKQAQKTSERQDDPLVTAKVLDGLAKTYSALKQPANNAAAVTKRLQVLKTAASDGTAALDKLAKSTPIAREAEAKLLLTAERGARACEEMQSNARAVDAWQRTAAVYKKKGNVDGQIRCLRALGAVLDLYQKPRESLEARQEAVVLARTANQSALAALIVQEMIQSFIALDELDNALEGFTELTPIIEQAGNIRGAAQVLEARGSLLAKHGHPEEALRDLDNARNRYLRQVGDVWSAAKVALDLARVQNAAGKSEDARTNLESAIESVESSYGYESFGPGMSEERVGTMRSLYRDLLSSYVLAKQPEAATDLVRKGRRHAWLAKLIVEMRSDTSDPAVAEWAKDVDVMVMDGPAPTVQTSGNKLIASDWATFAESCFWLERQHSKEYNSLPADPLQILKRRDALPPNLLVVTYVPTELSVYALVCGRDTAICRQIGVQKGALDSHVSRLRRTLKNCEESLGAGIPIPPMMTWQEAAFLEIKEPLAGLYSQLVGPIIEDIRGAQRIAFVLPAELSGLPVHALVSSDRGPVPEFLVDDFEISYLARGMVDDLAGPDSRTIDPSSDRLSIFADPEDSLPGARKEGAEIRDAYSASRSYVGREEATTPNFLAECAKANILHIAAHHRLDPNPSGFQLLLAPGAGTDGTVTLRDLSGVDNPYLQLVVLSACNSIGSIDPVSMGPARAAEVFSLIGAKSVLGGLWKVSDEAASKVMGDFYRGLSRGKSRAEALQTAQRGMIESRQFAHPFYWACFALYGNPR